MNGVMGHYTGGSSFEWSMPWFDWVVPINETLGFWIWFSAAILAIFGLVFCAVKGKWGFVLIALILPGIGSIISVIGGVRLAKPRSIWAHRLYDRKTMAEAIARHEPPIDLERYPERKLRKGYDRPLNKPSTEHIG